MCSPFLSIGTAFHLKMICRSLFAGTKPFLYSSYLGMNQGMSNFVA
jgi:hypothetical protein